MNFNLNMALVWEQSSEVEEWRGQCYKSRFHSVFKGKETRLIRFPYKHNRHMHCVTGQPSTGLWQCTRRGGAASQVKQPIIFFTKNCPSSPRKGRRGKPKDQKNQGEPSLLRSVFDNKQQKTTSWCLSQVRIDSSLTPSLCGRGSASQLGNQQTLTRSQLKTKNWHRQGFNVG